MSTIRYLIVHKDHPLHLNGVNSGAENATLWLARTLAQGGCEVVVCAQLPEGETERWGVSFWDLGADFDIAKALKRARSGAPYHLISACRAYPLLASLEEEKCLTRHFIAHDPSSGAAGIKPEILSRICDSMICVSEAQKGLFVEGGADPQKIKVIPNGADTEFFKAGEPEKRNYKRFVFVGAIVPHKGVDILITAFARVLAKHPDAQLDIYGSAGLWGQTPFINEQDIASKVPNIRFNGAVQQTEIAKAFAEAGACIIPSRWFDSFPLTAVEAQVAGCPVIAFNVGGIREAVRHNETGILIDTVNEDALERVLLDVLNAPQRLKGFSQAALNTSRKVFTWEAVAKQFRDHCERFGTKPATEEQKPIGVLTTWNQECGLATYARFMTMPWDKGSYVIFGEETESRNREDEAYVSRCWKRDSDDFTRLKSAIQASGVGILHLNCQAQFFPQPSFANFIKEIQGSGVKVIAHVHALFTFDKQLQALLKSVDGIIVHSPENRLEAIANGAHPDKISVIPHGVHKRPAVSDLHKLNMRAKLGIPAGDKIVVTFGFVQPHKGVEGLLEGVIHLNNCGVSCTGIVAGKPHKDDAESVPYQNELKRIAKEAGVEKKVIFLDKFLTEEEVTEYLSLADYVLLNYKSKYYEASGACSLALGAGATVVTSIAPPFLPFHDAVFHATNGYPVGYAFLALASTPELVSEIRKKAAQYCEENSWENIREKIFEIYRQFGVVPGAKVQKEQPQSGSEKNSMKKIKVLLHNRPTTFTQRGGDTVVIEKLLAGLKDKHVEVTVDLEAKQDPKNFDIVHIFNFAIPDMVRFYGERAKAAGKPFVVTTLLEDIPTFHNQSHYMAAMVQGYVENGQSQEWWSNNKPDCSAIKPSEGFNNHWTAQNASALFTNGETESRTVKKTYGEQSRTREIRLGYEIGLTGDGERFAREFGVKDFVFCVGRLESRKNQLMLLKALEHDDMTVVFAGGGFSYQPEYAAAVQKFKRKGKTIFLPRLTDQQLADAYAAAKVHALPSWYELPGLVSLEAAYYGCNVVATRRGTSEDYLGEDAFYCEPADADSIRSAVLAAYYSPIKTGLKEKIMANSWEETARRTLDAYQELSGWTSVQAAQVPQQQTVAIEPTLSTAEVGAAFEEHFEKGEIAAKNGEFEQALKCFEEAERLQPNTQRLMRARGAIELASGDFKTAKKHFAAAVAADSFDAKSFCGLGMCEVMDNDREAGYKHFVKALEIKPDHNVAMFQLMECSYVLNRFNDLETALRRFISTNPNDLEMLFCLAGCLYKSGNLAEAESINKQVLTKNASHTGGLELERLLADAKKQAPTLGNSVEVVKVEQSRSDISSVTMDFSSVQREIVDLEDLKRKGKFAEVESAIKKILDNQFLKPLERETAQCLLAEVLVLQDAQSQAESLYDSVLMQNPKSARALCGRGAIAASRGDWNVAKDYFDTALSYRPEYDVALSGLGLCATQNKSYDSAWNYYQRALNSNSENNRALLGTIEIGYVLRKLPEVEAALKDYLSVHPADVDFMYSLAGCCFAQGKVDEAVEEINRITLFDPSHKNALELKEMITRAEQPSA